MYKNSGNSKQLFYAIAQNIEWPGRLGKQNTQMASLQRGKTLYLHDECPRYDTKQSDGEVPVILEFWGMQSILSL